MRVRLHGPAGDFILAEGDNILGRATDCSLLVNDPRLSRHHARFTQLGAALRVSDMGSMNGVLVNGARIPGPTVLKADDIVVCGPCRFTCFIDPEGHPGTKAVITATVSTHQIPGTEPIDPDDATQPEAPRAHGRMLDSKIAAAIGTTRTGHPAAADDGTSDALKPDDQLESKTTSALSNHPPQGHTSSPSRPGAYHTTNITPHENRDRGDSALQPRVGARAGIRRCLIGGSLDALAWLALQVVLTVPLAVIGYVLALHAQGVEIAAGLPRISPVGVEPAPWSQLISSLFERGAFTRAIELLPQLSEERHAAPFAILFATATAIILAVALAFVLTLVASTVLHGGPHWHRRMGLEIVAMSDGSYPSWPRAALRWLLLFLLWPLAVIAILLGKRSPHDVLSGCDVRRRAQ